MQNALLFIMLAFSVNTLQAQINSTKAFESCYGKLPLPVKHFNKAIDNSKSNSNSDHDLATIFTSDLSDSIFSICDGKIISIVELDSTMYGLIVNIGAYYLVYSPIKPTNFKKGDTIKQHQFIGFVSNFISFEYHLSIKLLNNKGKEIPIYNWFKWDEPTLR
jgi:hypothetical protein